MDSKAERPKALFAAFFYPDYTVGSGVSPDHALRFDKLSKRARGLYRRSGIGALRLTLP